MYTLYPLEFHDGIAGRRTLSREKAVWREAASSMSSNASFSSRLSCGVLGLYLQVWSNWLCTAKIEHA